MSKFNDTVNNLMLEAGVFKGADEDELKKRKSSKIERLREELMSKGTMRNGRLDVDDSVDLYNIELTELPLKFGRVTGYFDCTANKLTSLEGAPTEVVGYFDCRKNMLTSLKGAPIKVGGNFLCYDNPGEFTEKDVRTVCDVKGVVYK